MPHASLLQYDIIKDSVSTSYYIKCKAKVFGMKNRLKKLPSKSLHFSGLGDCCLCFNIIPTPSKVTFPQLGLESLLSYPIGSCHSQNSVFNFAKVCSAPGFSCCSQETRCKKMYWKVSCWLDKESIFFSVMVYCIHKCLFAPRFCEQLLYFCALGCSLNNDIAAG